MRRVLAVAFSFFALLLLTACDLDTVAEVKHDPFKFEKRDAHLGGIVTESFSVLGYGFYQVEDPTGRIYVISRGKGVPGRGAKVEIRGKAINAFSLSGVDYGTVINESKRKLHH
jgi:hypothetical protein